MVMLVLLANAAMAQPPTRRILILTSYDPNHPAVTTITQSVSSTVRNQSSERVEFFFEYQENFRIPNHKYESEMVAYLKKKYEGVNINLIIGLGSPALNFVLSHDTELFQNTPKLFYFHDEAEENVKKLWPRVTGVWAQLHLDQTLEVALRNHPKAKTVFVIAGNSTQDKFLRAEAEKEFTAYQDRVSINYLSNLTIDELRAKLSQLPPESVVIYLSFFVDRNGNSYSGPEALSMVAPSSTAPIYGISDTYLGSGIVGGSLLDFKSLGKRTGELAVRILDGEKPQEIPPETSPTVLIFDWRELNRWGVDERSLPAGSLVRFKEYTFWEKYKWYAIAFGIAGVTEALLIIWLLSINHQRKSGQKALQRKQAELSGIIETAMDAIISVDESQKIILFNDAAEKIFKCSAAAALGQPLDKFIPPRFRGVHSKHIQLFGENRETRRAMGAQLDVWGLDAAGEEFPVEASISQISISGKKFFTIILRDISERKRADDQLRQSEERFGKAFRSNPQPMSLTTIDKGIYVDVNASFLNMSGYAREEVIGNSSLDLNIWETPDSRKKFLQNLEDHGSVVNLETKFRTKDGSLRVLLSSAERLELDGEQCLLVASSDVTERVRAQQAFRESEARFRNMADSAPVMIWVAGEDKQATYFNDQWLTFTGRTIEQEVGSGWSEGIHPDDSSRCLDIFNKSFDSRTQFEIEYRFRRNDGEYRWVLDCGIPRFSENSEFLGFIGSCIDITERRESEEQLRKAHGELNELKNQLEAENIYLQAELQMDHTFGEIVGQSDAIKYVTFKINQIAPTDSTVMITGETGTGKELVARAIHEASKRANRPLVKVNCAALSPTLIETELFGHEKGAFTGAGARKIGRFEIADGGTIFLDEIGEMPLESQVKLLRVIQEGEIERVGSTKTIKVDVRIIAATNRNLKDEVDKGNFRQDLWYRLNVFPITVPPLRQRRDDIPLLVDHFAKRASRKFGRTIESVSARTMHALQAHFWPGNVRELANVIERAVIHTQGNVLHLAEYFGEAGEDETTAKSLEEIEREYILRILESTGWRIEGPFGAAKILDLNPSTLRTRMAKLNIQKRRTSKV